MQRVPAENLACADMFYFVFLTVPGAHPQVLAVFPDTGKADALAYTQRHGIQGVATLRIGDWSWGQLPEYGDTEPLPKAWADNDELEELVGDCDVQFYTFSVGEPVRFRKDRWSEWYGGTVQAIGSGVLAGCVLVTDAAGYVEWHEAKAEEVEPV